MATSSDFALKITKLNGSNYRNWAFNIRLYLESLDLFGHVDGSAVSPAEDAADAIKKAFRSASKKAWTYICLAIEPEQQIHVRDTTTAKKAWDALKNQFARESILQKVRLRQSYYTCKFPSGGNMLAHINHMRSLHDQMKEMGINVDDKGLAMTLLGSLPEQFKPLITALDAVGEDNLSFEKVKGMLQNDADRMSDTKKAEDAFSAQRGFARKGKRWPRHDNPRKGDGKTGKSFSGLCHYCQERGHFARDCPKKNPKNDGSNYKNKKSANIVEHEKKDAEEEVINQEALFTSNNNSNPGWIIDSGATQHMTYEWSRLVNYVEFKRPCKVNLGDDRTIFAFGKGTYNLVADLGNGSTQNIALKEVLYLPDLKKNLLSVQTMTKLNASIQFDGTECKIMRNSKLLATGKINEKLYMLMIIPDVEYINVAKERPNNLLSNGYTKSTADPCVYSKTMKSQDGRIHFVIIAIYVDDMMFFSNNTEMLEREKKAIAKRFQVEDLGELHYVLGMDIVHDREQRTTSISQKKYQEGVLKKFDMENCKPVSTPLEFGKKYEELSKEDKQFDTRTYQRAIGCLIYAATISRPHLSTAISVLSKFMSKPGVEHWKGVKRVLRYVQGTLDYGLINSADDTSTTLTGYTDADWAGDLSTRRSTTGYVFQVQGNTLSWCSKRQGCVARSTTEAEYIALSTASQEAVWLRRLLESVLKKQDKPTTLCENNQGAIELTKNPKFHNRTKHINVSYHYAREQVDNKIISLKYCRTENMLADVMTKGLTKAQFEKFRDMLGLIKIK